MQLSQDAVTNLGRIPRSLIRGRLSPAEAVEAYQNLRFYLGDQGPESSDTSHVDRR